MPQPVTFQIYELDFGNASLHLSRGKSNTYTDSESLLHSDSIKSAIFSTAIELFGEDEIKESFFDEFNVSSAFPVVKNKYFLPKPAHFGVGVEDPKLRKSLNEVQFLELKFWEKYAKGLQDETHLTTRTILKSAFRSESTQRVWIKYAYEGKEDEKGFDYDKLDDEDFNLDSTPFYIEKKFLEKDHKLYFMIQITEGVKSDEFYKRMDGIMRLLGDNGIGLQRSIGNGHFVAQRKEITVDLPTNPNAQMSLSLYCPADATTLQELNLSQSFYKLIKRGGWISTPVTTFRKRSIYMFTEGSVFKTPTQPNGKKENLQPAIFTDHEIWRDGSALFLPIHLSKE